MSGVFSAPLFYTTKMNILFKEASYCYEVRLYVKPNLNYFLLKGLAINLYLAELCLDKYPGAVHPPLHDSGWLIHLHCLGIQHICTENYEELQLPDIDQEDEEKEEDKSFAHYQLHHLLCVLGPHQHSHNHHQCQ